MKKLLILLVTIIFVACNKENVNPNRVSDEKNIYGKWYVNNPSVWVMNISTTRITYTNGVVKEIISIDDTAVWKRIQELILDMYIGYIDYL